MMSVDYVKFVASVNTFYFFLVSINILFRMMSTLFAKLLIVLWLHINNIKNF